VELGRGTCVSPRGGEQIGWLMGLAALFFASSESLCGHLLGAGVLIFQDAAAVLSHS